MKQNKKMVRWLLAAALLLGLIPVISNNFALLSANAVYISDMEWASETPGMGGFAARDQSSYDGYDLYIKKYYYAKGIGATVDSVITIELDGQYDRFLCDVGLDAMAESSSDVFFEVYADNSLIHQSDEFSADSGNYGPETIDLDVSGMSMLTLQVVPVWEDWNYYTYGSEYFVGWADAQLISNGNAVLPASVSVTISPNALIIPQSGSVNATSTAVVKDSGGNTLVGQTITWSLAASYTGVSINSTTGMVTVASNASPGTVTVKATCGSIFGTANLTLFNPGPDSVSVTISPNTLTVSQSVSVTAASTAVVKDSLGNILSGQTITWSLATSYTGVSINSTTGLVTVAPNTIPGTVTVKATCDSVSGTAILSLTNPIPSSVTVAISPNTLTIPQSGTVNATSTAVVKDSGGNTLVGQTITWSLAISHTGVSINSTTGIVTVDSSAAPGTVTVKAVCGSVFGTAELTLEGIIALEMSLTANQEYIIPLTVENLVSFVGETFTLNYDTAKLQLLDFAAQTGKNTISTGAVSGTQLTIVSHTNGVLKFTVGKSIPSGKTWSGVITIVKFKGLSSGSATITLE